MSVPEPSFSIGAEEEYLLVDPETRMLVTEPPADLIQECESLLGSQFSPEFLRAQIEVGTKVCNSIQELRADLVHLRRTIAKLSSNHGLVPIASSTHPFAQWRDQKHTDRERYNILREDMQVVAQRLLIGGMHTHVAIESHQLRIDILNQVQYFMPHLLALSTSSPFWEGMETGLKCYRLCVFSDLPRTGLPERFESFGEYRRTVELMVEAGLIDDASKLWWDVRPNSRFPTLEMRITDMCTSLDDAICCAAFYRCICRMLFRLRRKNQRWRTYPALLINENRWRAQRYGLDEGMVDFGRGEIVSFPELIDELIELVHEDADFFQCIKEVEHARTIIKRGTSAHQQLKAYHEAKDSGATEQEALQQIVDLLIHQTLQGL